MARSLPASLPVPADMRRSAPNWAYHARIDHELPVEVEPIGSKRRNFVDWRRVEGPSGPEMEHPGESPRLGRPSRPRRGPDDVCSASTMPTLRRHGYRSGAVKRVSGSPAT